MNQPTVKKNFWGMKLNYLSEWNHQIEWDKYKLTHRKYLMRISTQINRMNLLNLIKLFINEIRENYLKSIKENSNIQYMTIHTVY